jgi:hypothetical protein
MLRLIGFEKRLENRSEMERYVTLGSERAQSAGNNGEIAAYRHSG